MAASTELQMASAVCLLGRHPQHQRDRDEALLRAVVEVALEAAPGLVRRGDQALPGALQVFDEPEVTQHQTGL